MAVEELAGIVMLRVEWLKMLPYNSRNSDPINSHPVEILTIQIVECVLR